MINFNKKGISPVIATILLLAITVIIAVGVYQFLSSYTQDTYESIQGDQTLSLQFGGKISLYEGGNGNSTMNIGAIDFEQSSYNFTEVIFRGPSGNEECILSSDLQVNQSTSTRVDLGGDCDPPVVLNSGSRYDVLLIGDSTVEVGGVRYS
ncbi:MAG: archaellin/type IV pilin N-terminal domain-containing protein [Candidatus Nanoarchaeia archaeon]